MKKYFVKLICCSKKWHNVQKNKVRRENEKGRGKRGNVKNNWEEGNNQMGPSYMEKEEAKER